MNCDLCNGTVQEKTGAYPFKSKTLGKVIVPNITFLECQECGDRAVPYKGAVALHKHITIREREEIKKLPASGLITAGEAAELLGVTKQAFSKNPKIKHGFIYYVTIGNRKAYFKKSVQLFKESGDGRFQIKTSWGKLLLLIGDKRKKKSYGCWETELLTPRLHHRHGEIVNGRPNGYTARA